MQSEGLIPTGNTLITFAPDTETAVARRSLSNLGLSSVATSSDFEAGPETVESVLEEAPAYFIEGINVAVVRRTETEGMGLLSAQESFARGSSIIEQRPEYFCFTQTQQVDPRYLAWLQEGAAILSGRAASAAQFLEQDEEGALALFNDTASHTWGVQAVRAHRSNATGQGIRVAVLDTGVDLTHPDLAGRIVFSQSFVPGQTVQDGHSHGTHCIGTACGPFKPPATRRYGVAHQSGIIAIKVLSNQGSGQESWILQGMQRAVQLGAQVISMSLGRGRAPTDPSAAYTNAGNFALANKSLIIAAAGNAAGQPVGAPANSPSIMAVGALDSNLNPAGFSSIGGMPNGGEVNIAGPGVQVFSSVPMNKGKYGTMSGTSMATPHVAGCAALWAQVNANNRGKMLWKKLEQTARALPHPVTRVGCGLVQSPVIRLIPPILDPRGDEVAEDESEAGNGSASRRGRKRGEG
jgi:hypothetical protein